jgi:hypothetical protein
MAYCDLCNATIQNDEINTIDSNVFKEAVSSGFNPYSVKNIDMSHSIKSAQLRQAAQGLPAEFVAGIQMALNKGDLDAAIMACRAFGGELPDAGKIKGPLAEHWKTMALNEESDWKLCKKCTDGFTNYEKKKSFCFIATAAFSPIAPEVLVLRTFRDECLAKLKVGQCFIRLYYFISPKIALWIEKSRLRKRITRSALLPVVSLLKTFNKRP